MQILDSEFRVARRSLLQACVNKWRVQFSNAITKQHEEKQQKNKQSQERKRKRTLHTNQRNRQQLQDEVIKAKIVGNYYMVCVMSNPNPHYTCARTKTCTQKHAHTCARTKI